MKNSILFFFVFISLLAVAQRRGQTSQPAQPASTLTDQTFAGLKLRNIGPAFASGRIADIAIHPEDDNVWYVAVGSGGVWKTTNAAVTWTPIFDDQPVYSTGCVTIDPNNPHIVWVGTGENVGGRHVGFGDGVYKSSDDGKSWTNMGLKLSEHISKIIVHPDNSDIVWVAAQGPLWNKGGERGLYKTTDGGKTWKKTLGDDEWVGVTDLVIDPRDPSRLYAATWQRHRTVAAYMGGGPGTALYRSQDGGETWEKLTKGIPKSNLGKIGLAISPQNPDILYAAIETDRKSGALYRSTDRGSSWEKMSNTVSGGTGPHYYQELYASPHAFDRLYLMDVRIQVSDDGGRTFRTLREREKHSDNHAIAFRRDDPDYLLVGCDAGLYESFDLAENWRFIDNLPVTQYYKLALDDREPFYHIYAGTQDNGSHGGPSRTFDEAGIRNADWYKTLGADGHQSATEPGNPNIMYAETQQGGLHRVDRITMEQVYIQPQPREGEDFERFNWDAPILVSPHKPSRLYFASQRVWKSENRGDSWTPISGDLTKNEERLTLPIMGKKQSWDNAWDVGAMSNYNSITSLAESPKQEGLIYAGTDDGIIQVTENGGQSWRKISVSALPGVPATAFVNDIRADLYDASTVYVCLDNHKYGDFSPYIYKSTDKGQTWRSLKANLPDKLLMWRTVQDHVKPNLLFAATEFGIYFTIDGGSKWTKLKGGVPTISFRDITIHRRDNDLVGASFGRGFFILDDISVLREVTEENLKAEGTLYSTRKAWWYQPTDVTSSPGAAEYRAPNPPFGAVFTYHLSEGLKTLEAERKEREQSAIKAGSDVPFPGWDALASEVNQPKPQVLLIVKDAQGNVVRRLEGATSKGMHRTAWDLTMASKGTISLEERPGGFGFGGGGSGFMVTPGKYNVTLAKVEDGQMTILSGPVEFDVVELRKGALDRKQDAVIAAFRSKLQDLQSTVGATTTTLNNAKDRVNAMQRALARSENGDPNLVKQLYDLNKKLQDLEMQVNGNPAKEEVGERNPPSVQSRMFVGFRGLRTTYGPTEMHQQSVDLAVKQIGEIIPKVKVITDTDIPAAERALQAAGAPWIEGQEIPKIGN
ncbi:MAG: glycosyl hydrolase [Cyclobacteriaceae bacterium]